MMVAIIVSTRSGDAHKQEAFARSYTAASDIHLRLGMFVANDFIKSARSEISIETDDRVGRKQDP